jgi:glycosyltransferase involved in cell wall biosynthesis
MKIALLTDGISPYVVGGMQKHSAYLAKYLVLNGVDLDLFHCVNSNDEIPSNKDINNFFFQSNVKSFSNIYTFIFPTSYKFPGHYLYNSYRYSKKVFEKIEDIDKYDFIYVKGFVGWKLLREKKRNNYNFKIGVKFHGYEMFQFAPSFKVKLQHYLLRYFVKWNNLNADYVFSYGGKITDIIKDFGIPNNKIIEIPTAIEKDWVINNVNLKYDTPKFLFIGRDERRKGMNELCESLKDLDELGIDFEMHFVGPFKDFQRLKLSNVKAIYHGLVKSIDKKKTIIDSCDVLICPSYSEGMPNVIIESMARGLAIIATNVGAIELLVDVSNGLLLNNHEKTSLKNAILYFINLDSNSIHLMKLSSIDKVKKLFLWEVVSKDILNKI